MGVWAYGCIGCMGVMVRVKRNHPATPDLECIDSVDVSAPADCLLGVKEAAPDQE